MKRIPGINAPFDNAAIGIAIAFGVCFFFLYTRRMKWAKPEVRWIISAGLFILGISGWLLDANSTKEDLMLYWGLCVPLFYYAFDRLFRMISIRRNGRDFILWLKGSSEIDDSFGGKNPHVKGLDMVLSLGLLIFIVVITLVWALVLK